MGPEGPVHRLLGHQLCPQDPELTVQEMPELLGQGPTSDHLLLHLVVFSGRDGGNSGSQWHMTMPSYVNRGIASGIAVLYLPQC